jgi:hypothetical protein
MRTEIGSGVPIIEQAILTGSTAAGRLSIGGSCVNWTSNDALDICMTGSTNWFEGVTSWNFALGAACDEVGLHAVAGSGRLYCFAVTGAQVPALSWGLTLALSALLVGAGCLGAARQNVA